MLNEYKKCLETFRAWVNWNKSTDMLGLLLGLADQYCEIRILEDALNIPENQRFRLEDYVNW